MDTNRPRARVAVLWAGVLVFFTVGYFENNRPLANVISQFCLTRAIVEQHTFAIDAFLNDASMDTVDKAVFNGHTYCDKSPVNAFLGVPVYAAYCWITHALKLPSDYNDGRYWTAWMVEGGAAALLAMMLAGALLRRGVDPPRAGLGAALWIAATPLLGFSIHFYNYLPACVMLLGGYLLAAGRPENETTKFKIFLGGLLMGLAAWTLNTCALAALVVTPVVAGRGCAGKSGMAARLGGAWRNLWPWGLGGAMGIAGYFIYNHAVFGSFASPYRFEANPYYRDNMARGLMGATWPPQWRVAWLLTGHKFQGLFLWFPVTALALGAAIWMSVRRGRSAWAGERAENAAGVALFIGLLTYNSAYYMWWGGYTYAPRHLIPALALLGLELAPWLRGPRVWPGRVLLTVAAAGAVINVAAVLVNPQPWPGFSDPELLRYWEIKEWTSPFLELQKLFWVKQIYTCNWGSAVGMRGSFCILPLVTAWLAGWRWLYVKCGGCKEDNSAGPSGGK